jgi:alkylation response protein AidB-like acyl-CoA dehydrogenase
MTIGVASEHEALRDAVRGWAARHVPREVVRQAADATGDTLPSFWEKLAEQSLLGLHLPEEHGGGGYGTLELAVVLEELGRALAPGPFLPTVLASALVARGGSAGARQRLLPALADGAQVGAVGLAAGLTAVPASLTAVAAGDGVRVSGETAPVLGGCVADVLVLPANGPDGEIWFVVDAAEVSLAPVPGIDLTRRLARVEINGLDVPADRVLAGLDGAFVRDLAAVLAAAEATGVAAWCLTTAVEHAKVREQFGRPIGQFQAVKHRCAEMLLAVEQARAAAWDAARAADTGDGASPAEGEGAPAGEGAPLAAGVAAVLGPDAAVHCAKECIQVLGGIGFTWEHDAHLYLRRAMALRSLVGTSAGWAGRVADLTVAGAHRSLDVELPVEAEPMRAEIRVAAAQLAGLPPDERRRLMADAGWILPHFPPPWGRGAGPVEQLVIQQEFGAAGVSVPDLVIGAWVVPTLARFGTPEQQERFLPGTLRGELAWCQLFSEPGAGSDLAALSTRAERVEGGWRLTGQKIWTSVAHEADWGICLARTDPAVPKHKGITYFLVDMASAGLDVRPLRELTGRAMFNEVFLDDVFVPDECVVGAPGEGWRLARTTLANERVALSSSWAMTPGVADLLRLLTSRGTSDGVGGLDPAVRPELGRLICAEQAFALLGLRATLRRLSGMEPGPESSTRKLLGIRHAQRVTGVGWSLLGAGGATLEGDDAFWTGLMLGTRAMSIAGGTTEVQLNILAERVLGLPRDP